MTDKPSYLRGTDLQTDNDNSHVFEAEISGLSVSDVDSEGTVVHIPPAHDLESELSEIRTDNPSPKQKFGLSSFADLILAKVAESDAGNMASHGFWLVDKYHATNADTLTEWQFTAQVSNARTPTGESVAERLSASEKTVFDAAYKVGEEFKALSENRLPEYGNYEEAKEGSDLREMTDYAVWNKTVYQVYMGARVEELAGEVLCEALNDDEWIAHSEKVSEATGIDTPEAKGIDLYLPERDTTVQVKRGSGGNLRDCEADWIARYHAPDNDGKAGRDARLTIERND